MGSQQPADEGVGEGHDAAADPASALFLRYRREHDRAALEQALLLCGPALRTAARQLGDAGDADDLVHDCFVVAIGRADRFDERGRLLPWLLGILQNVARSRHRLRWWRLRAGSLGGAIETTAATEDATAVVDRTEWFHAVSARAQVLPEPYRTVVVEHLIAGQSLAAIAARLGRPANTVRSQFARGLQELRRRLPAPLLTGLAAVLATRSASATASPWSSPRTAARAFTVVAVLVATGLGIWGASSSPGALASAAGAASPRVTTTAAAATPLPEAGANERMLASAPPTPAVSVRLNYADGQPAAGVPVILEPNYTLGMPVVRAQTSWKIATTDAAGDVHFAVDTRGSVAIRLHDTAVLHRFEVTDTPRAFTFTIPPAPELVVSLVDDEQRPIVGGTIIVSALKGVSAPGFPAATTDVEGKARIRCVLPRYYMWALADGHAAAGSHTVHAHSLNDSANSFTLQLRRSLHRCRGRVESHTGEPVANATVAVWSEIDRSVPPLFLATDASGRFEASWLAEGSWSVAAVAPGFARALAERLAAADEPVLELTRGGGVHGRVERSTHADLSALRIKSLTLDGNDWDPLGAVGGVVAADGSFQLPPLAPGEHRVGMFDGSSQPVETHHVTVVEGATTEIVFTRGASLSWTLRVVDEHDRALADHVVRTESALDRVGNTYEQRARTDAHGIARLAVSGNSPKRLYVYLPLDGDTDVVPALALGPMAPGSLTTVTLPAAARVPCRLRGRLPTEYWSPGETRSVALCCHGGTRNVSLFADGRFAAEHLPAGSYQLRVVRAGAAGGGHLVLADLTLQPGEDVDLGTMPSPAFGATSLALAADCSTTGVAARLTDSAGNVLEAMQVERGHSLHRRLPRGRYTVEYADSDAAVRQVVFDVAEGGTLRVVLERTRGNPCRVEVVSSGLHARGGGLLATLQAGDRDSPCVLVLPMSVDDRSWSIDIDLRPGVYRFAAFCGDGSELHETIVVSARPEQRTFPLRLR